MEIPRTKIIGHNVQCLMANSSNSCKSLHSFRKTAEKKKDKRKRWQPHTLGRNKSIPTYLFTLQEKQTI